MNAGEGAMSLISTTLDISVKIANQFSYIESIAATKFENLYFAEPQLIYATDENDLYRQIVLMNCSLSVLPEDDFEDSDEIITTEREANPQWTTRVRKIIEERRPALMRSFNKSAVLVDQGYPVKFNFLTSGVAVNLGLLTPTGLTRCVDEARTKLFKLSLAKKRDPSRNTALILGVPRDNEITLLEKQREALRVNKLELMLEAQHENVIYKEVNTDEEAADSLLELV